MSKSEVGKVKSVMLKSVYEMFIKKALKKNQNRLIRLG